LWAASLTAERVRQFKRGPILSAPIWASSEKTANARPSFTEPENGIQHFRSRPPGNCAVVVPRQHIDFGVHTAPMKKDGGILIVESSLGDRRQVKPFHPVVRMPTQWPVAPSSTSASQGRIANVDDVFRALIATVVESEESVSSAREFELIA
jgi:hypothetical protein